MPRPPRRIPASLTRRYNRAIKRQGGAAEKSTMSALREFLAENPGASIEDVRDFSIDLMKAAGDLYGKRQDHIYCDFPEHLI